MQGKEISVDISVIELPVPIEGRARLCCGCISRAYNRLVKIVWLENCGFPTSGQGPVPKPHLFMSATLDLHDGNSFSPFEAQDLERSISARFEEQVRKFSDRAAVRTRHVTRSYSALNREANRIAHAIAKQCGTESQQVAASPFSVQGMRNTQPTIPLWAGVAWRKTLMFI
jgi:hypothetical protein